MLPELLVKLLKIFSVVITCCCSVSKFYPTLCDSIECMQYARLSCPLLFPRVCSNSYSLNPWCHPTISSSVTLFSSCPHSFPESSSFPMSRFFASGGQTIGASPLVSVLPMNIQGWFPSGLTGFLSSCCPRDSQESYLFFQM